MLVACACTLLSVYAQSTPAAKACVAEVRQMYQEAKAMMAESDKHEETQNDMEVTISSMEPAVGRQVTRYHYYFLNDFSEERNEYVSTPYFVTKSFNVAPRKYYEEYLFDHSSATLRFVFLLWDDYDGKKVEERYYFDRHGKLVWRQLKNAEEQHTEKELKQLAKDIVNGFNSLKR